MFEEKYLEFWRNFGESKKMVLSTSFDNIVTSRTMSIIQSHGKLYFQTDAALRKYHQLKNNPHVALCIDNIQIEGICMEIGSPAENADFCDAYKACFPSAFRRYTMLENERLFVVTPTFIESWVYIDSIPYIQILDIKNRKYISKQYNGV